MLVHKINTTPLWSMVSFAIILVILLFFLNIATTNPIVMYDGYAVWTLHSLFIYGGHHILLSDLRNTSFNFSHPGYPILIPASGALAFIATHNTNITVAVITTAILNLCGLGIIALGILNLINKKSNNLSKLTSLFIAITIIAIGFGLGGYYSIGGYADLLWSALAVSAIVFGTVLPKNKHYFIIACILAVAASLTKDEGALTALLIFIALPIRYVPIKRKVIGRLKQLIVAFVLIIPYLAWFMTIHFLRISSKTAQYLSVSYAKHRAYPALSGVISNLHILAIAFFILILGYFGLRAKWKDYKLGNPLLYWFVILGSSITVLLAYILGPYNIIWWIGTSINRTTIFPQLAAYTSIAICLVIAIDRKKSRNAESQKKDII